MIETYFTVGVRKPDPKSLNDIIRKLKVKKNNVLFIGDSICDVIAGRRANVKTVGVTTGVFSEPDLLKEQPYSIINSIGEVKDFI